MLFFNLSLTTERYTPKGRGMYCSDGQRQHEQVRDVDDPVRLAIGALRWWAFQEDVQEVVRELRIVRQADVIIGHEVHGRPGNRRLQVRGEWIAVALVAERAVA